jgi:hypothetical protein
MTIRAATMNANELAMPVRKEHAENPNVAITNRSLRLPTRSEILLIAKAASAHEKEKTPAIVPTCVLDKRRSGITNGIKKFSALRSKNRMPKLRLSSPTSQA